MSRESGMGEVKRLAVATIRSCTGVGTAAAEHAYAELRRALLGLVATSDKVVVRGLGTFTWVRRPARKVKSGGPFGRVIPAYDHLKFRSYGACRRRRNDDR